MNKCSKWDELQFLTLTFKFESYLSLSTPSASKSKLILNTLHCIVLSWWSLVMPYFVLICHFSFHKWRSMLQMNWIGTYRMMILVTILTAANRATIRMRTMLATLHWLFAQQWQNYMHVDVAIITNCMHNDTTTLVFSNENGQNLGKNSYLKDSKMLNVRSRDLMTTFRNLVVVTFTFKKKVVGSVELHIKSILSLLSLTLTPSFGFRSSSFEQKGFSIPKQSAHKIFRNINNRHDQPFDAVP